MGFIITRSLDQSHELALALAQQNQKPVAKAWWALLGFAH